MSRTIKMSSLLNDKIRMETTNLGVGRETIKKRSDNELKELWSSMFRVSSFSGLNESDNEVLGILMLLQTAVTNVRQYASQYTNIMATHKLSLKDLEEKNKECNQLRETLRNVKDCKNCSVLKKDLEHAKHKAQEAQTRMNSIARILNLGGDKESTENLVSQMLMYPDSPKRKHRSKKVENSENVDEILAPATEVVTCTERIPLIDGDAKCIPETAYELSQHLTPTKMNSIVESPEVSPVLERLKKRRKVLSSSVNIPPEGGNKVIESQRKNVSADSFPVGTPEKPVLFNIRLDEAREEVLEKTIIFEDSQQPGGAWEGDPANNSELDRIWFSEEKASPPQKQESPQSRWKLRESREVGSRSGGGKRLKQMKLGLANKEKRIDITQLSKKNGNDSTSDNDEIILPSPTGKKNKKGRRLKVNETLDLSCFAPVATSTQVPKNLENSFDRIPEKESKSPKYKYKGGPVRKRDERAVLEGRPCAECEEYFRVVGKDLTPEELKERMKACSRHKDKPLRSKTPPGFWDPDMPDTQECRARGAYTSVYLFKESKK